MENTNEKLMKRWDDIDCINLTDNWTDRSKKIYVKVNNLENVPIYY